MEPTLAQKQSRSAVLSRFVLVLAVLAVPSLAVPLTNSIEFGDIKCKLPGWPGHPAPTCDPNVPNQCCAGTKCAPDPYDPTHSTCQQADISVSEHALTASVLTSHVETLLTDALTQLKVASTSLYLSGNRETTLSDEDIVMRAQSLVVSNHGNVDTGAAGSNDWHKYAHGGENPQNIRKEKNTAQGTGESSTGQGGFDYSKYYGGGGQSASGSNGGSSGSQGGFDYQKYMPKNIPSNSGNDDKKTGKKAGKDGNEKDHSDTPPSNEGQGGFDYSQYYPYSGDPHKKGYHGTDSTKDKNPNVPTTDSRPSKQGDGQKDGFDYSQYWPKPASKSMAEPLDEDDTDILKKAGLQLLQADAEYKAASAQAKRDVLERVRGILDRLESMVDRELGEVEGEHNWSMDGTKSPTLVWNDPSDFWSKYIPKMPNQGYGNDNNANNNGKDGGSSFNTGDRKPGSLGGPCGRTSYKDFGPCTGELKCVGLDAQRPGLCQVEKAKTMQISREAALHSLKLAEEASMSIKAAAVELLVGAAPSNNLSGDEDGVNGQEDSPMEVNKSTLDVGEYSPTTIAVVLLGVAVLGYFCWLNTSGKRRAYQNIDSGWGARA